MSSGTAEGPKNWRGGGGGTLSKGQLFRNVFLVSSILPKNERKQFDLRYHSSSWVNFFRSFFGRPKNLKYQKTFRN